MFARAPPTRRPLSNHAPHALNILLIYYLYIESFSTMFILWNGCEPLVGGEFLAPRKAAILFAYEIRREPLWKQNGIAA